MILFRFIILTISLLSSFAPITRGQELSPDDLAKPPYVKILFQGESWKALNFKSRKETVLPMSDGTLLMVHSGNLEDMGYPALLLHRITADGTLLWRKILVSDHFDQLNDILNAPLEKRQSYLQSYFNPPDLKNPYRYDARRWEYTDDILVAEYRPAKTNNLSGIVISDSYTGLWLIDGNGEIVWSKLPVVDYQIQRLATLNIQADDIYLGGLGNDESDSSCGRGTILRLKGDGTVAWRWQDAAGRNFWRIPEEIIALDNAALYYSYLDYAGDKQEIADDLCLYGNHSPDSRPYLGGVAYMNKNGVSKQIRANYWGDMFRLEENVVITDELPGGAEEIKFYDAAANVLKRRVYHFDKLIGALDQCDGGGSSYHVVGNQIWRRFSYRIGVQSSAPNPRCPVTERWGENVDLIMIMDRNGRVLQFVPISGALSESTITADHVFFQGASLDGQWAWQHLLLSKYVELGYYRKDPVVGPTLFIGVLPNPLPPS